jgi:hypothetical protein
MFFDMPSPPTWATEAALTFLRHVAQPMYWLLFVAGIFAYLVLRWQRRPNETKAARGLRWRELGKSFLWLALALGRTFGEWQLILWATAVMVALFVTLGWLLSLYLSYVKPARLQRRAVASDVLPPHRGSRDAYS